MDDDEPVRSHAASRIGRVLKDKWRLDSLLGVGGMAAVYAATHRNSKRVAVKILHSDMSSDAHVRERFLREGYAANRVGHPGAVDILDDDVGEDGSAFLVMELLDGENLDRRMRRKGGRLPATEVLSLADQVLDTLAAAHSQGILHRDIKPENIFLTRGGVVKLLDFGIARVLELSPALKVTQRGAILGTPAFMAPEQAMAIWEEVDPRSDIWAVGATLFMLLTGDFVHQARTGMEALDFAVTRRARSVGAVGVHVPPVVAEVVDRALSFERDQRFQNARDMQDAVRAAYAKLEGDARMAQLSSPGDDVSALPQQEVVTNPAPAQPAIETPALGAQRTLVSQRRSNARAWRLALAVVALALAAVALALLRRAPPPPAPAAESERDVAPTESPGAAPMPPLVSPSTTVPASVVQMASAVPVLAVSALPYESTAQPTTTHPRPARTEVTAAPASEHRPTPSKPPSVVPDLRPLATEPPSAAPHVSGPPASPAVSADPFSGRFSS